jgi:hypothetical protein
MKYITGFVLTIISTVALSQTVYFPATQVCTPVDLPSDLIDKAGDNTFDTAATNKYVTKTHRSLILKQGFQQNLIAQLSLVTT